MPAAIRSHAALVGVATGTLIAFTASLALAAVGPKPPESARTKTPAGTQTPQSAAKEPTPTGSAPETGPVDASVSAAVDAMATGQAVERVATTATVDLSPGDRHFLEAAIRAGRAEIETAELAQRQAANPEVHRLAQHLEMDHKRSNVELEQMAGRAGIVLAQDAGDQDRAQMNSLQALTGTRFDMQYLHEQLAAHQKAIQLFRQEDQTGRNSELRAFAHDNLPRVMQHLRLLEGLQQQGTTLQPPATPNGQ